MKILWLSPRWPYPDNTGARKASMALLSELTEAAKRMAIPNFQINLVCIYEGEEELQSAAQLESLTSTRDNLYLPKPNLPGGSNLSAFLRTRIFHPTTPFTIQKYTSHDLKAKVHAWLRGRQFDVTIIDGLHGAAIVDFSDSRYGRFIHRAHNVENDLWRQMLKQEKNPLKKLVWLLEFVLFVRFEKRVCAMSAKTLAVSEMDRERFQRLVPGHTAEALGIGAAIESEPLPFPQDSKILNLLFVGRLDWEPNKKGLAWFLKEVWPAIKIERPVQLTIIGSGQSDWLEPLLDSQMQLLRNVPDLKPFYKECHLTLIPLFMGSGTRVKAIESGSFGRSFLATHIGVEGLPYQVSHDYWGAECSAEWKKILIELDLSQAQQRGENAHIVTKNYFDKGSLARQLLAAVQQN